MTLVTNNHSISNKNNSILNYKSQVLVVVVVWTASRIRRNHMYYCWLGSGYGGHGGTGGNGGNSRNGGTTDNKMIISGIYT